MNNRTLTLLTVFAACGSLRAADTPTKPTSHGEASKEAVATVQIDPDASARTVSYGEREVIPIRARLRFTTLIVLPKREQILDYVCGDKEFWIVNGAQNFAYIKPAKAGTKTNLNLVTASGNVYSFVLSEASDGAADLKVFVEPKDDGMLSALSGAPRFVSAQQIDDYRQQVEMAKSEVRETKKTAQATVERAVNSFRSEYPAQMKFAYRFERDKKPFLVTTIFHDNKFTYIQANPQETPALYEVKDGKPNLINFQFKNGTYIVDKVLDSGYLAIGKQRLAFTRED